MNKKEVRQVIIDKASDLFYNFGYNLTSIDDITKEAGINEDTFYEHFNSKDEICLAYLKNKNDNFLKDLRAFALSKPKGEKQIIALFDFAGMFFKQGQFNGCWCMNTISQIPKEKKEIKGEIQKQKQQFLELISELLNDNYPEISEKENERLAQQIYLLYESAVAESKLHEASWPIDSARELGGQILG